MPADTNPDAVKRDLTITQALQSAEFSTLHVVYGNRWLVWDDGWAVYSKGYRQRRERAVIFTDDERAAVAELLKGMD